MSESDENATHPESKTLDSEVQLEHSTYEIIRGRLGASALELQSRLTKLNDLRRELFGSIPTELIATDRITTNNNCVPRDLFPIGQRVVFGFNVHIGLKSETLLGDVFAVFVQQGDSFHKDTLDILGDKSFEHDFKQLYKYYKETRFSKFHVLGHYLYMVFQVGKDVGDVKTFKWLIDGEQITYVDNRSDHESVFPSQYEFEWKRTHRDLHRVGRHPHISIEDRVFVETVGGDLTIKVEDNTEDGRGIYREPVDDADQVLDDAEIFYSLVGNTILLKIRPFKEQDFRYFIFNEKNQSVMRLDALRNACVLLPEDHGLVFSNGYYLQTGEHKTFPLDIADLLFEKRIASPNGEDFLYVFYNVALGTYLLLTYNMIEQRIDTPIQCHGFSIFDNGHLVYFKSDDSPQKHHAIQIWQTPFTNMEWEAPANSDSYLFKIGNRDIVRGMSECHEIIGLIHQDESFSNLYLDLVNKTTDVLDSYFWIDSDDTFAVGQTLLEIKETAIAAVDEYEKVKRIRHNTVQQMTQTRDAALQAVSAASRRQYQNIDAYTASLAELRRVRGQVISLRDLKYVEMEAIDRLESEIQENTERLSQNCVQYLLRADALQPYAERVETQRAEIDALQTVTQAKALEENLATASSDLEMLIDIVSNLKIDDATHRTQIIDDISTIYSALNQATALLKKKTKELLSVEGAAEFGSQLKLLSQAVVNYLDVCDSPARCDEYLTKMMVQVEELEGRFTEFDEFIVQLTEKREEIYAAFDARKLQIIEARNRRATSLAAATDRILKGIATRIASLNSVDEINSYFVSDMMIEKVRDLVGQLDAMDESVKVDEIQSRLKTVREDAVRQLHDKHELFVDGKNIIKLGRHQFTVNVQQLDLTSVVKKDDVFYHLTGTNFFEKVESPELLGYREHWERALVSEDPQVYRGEYLAYLFRQAMNSGEVEAAEEWLALGVEDRISRVQRFMSPRYAEGYLKGIHDHDAALILHSLITLQRQLGLLRYPSSSRALASMYWHTSEEQSRWTQRIHSIGAALDLFGDRNGRQAVVMELAELIRPLQASLGIGSHPDTTLAAGFLFDQLSSGKRYAGRVALDFAAAFYSFLDLKGKRSNFESGVADISSTSERYGVICEWLAGFSAFQELNEQPGVIFEAAALIVDGSRESRIALEGVATDTLPKLLGDHARIEVDGYQLDLNEFELRLQRFQQESVPQFLAYHEMKKSLLDGRRKALRLSEFKPHVLTSFVRNRLIDEVYLPMIGDNLAKQMGAAGESKRTDLMGLLLLISPPGYGKTTLMEYVANRLGLTFMKINGPAIGHRVTSLDPAEAPNASARDEVNKLNLALEMGDNVMIYLDDIQHCNPEFLQKFISLCDATRRIEGVFNGQTKTYDLRGRKVCVVMAGNPYTESGEKFQIPDMLASRADTYNLGDVIGDSQQAFELSYLENCLTSNPTLSHLHTRSRADVYHVVQMAQGTDGDQNVSVEGNFSVEEIGEFVSVMRKLVVIRDIVLKVNQCYIASAAQADDYRTEPAFKLQGSYRDMNKMAERVLPIMNEEELETLIVAHYENQAQTLTSDTQANLLKFRELLGSINDEEAERWSNIQRTFKRNVLLGSVAGDDKVSQIIAQMTTVSEGLSDIRSAITKGVKHLSLSDGDEQSTLETARLRQVGNAIDQLVDFNTNLAGIKELLQTKQQTPAQDDAPSVPASIQVVNKIPTAFTNIIRMQFRVMQTWMEPLLQLGEKVPEAKGLVQAAKVTEVQYKKMLDKLEVMEQDDELVEDE